jgi:hypothetical protein
MDWPTFSAEKPDLAAITEPFVAVEAIDKMEAA